jgi:hypothetical protein
MGFEQFDSIDSYAVSINDSQTTTDETLTRVLSDLNGINTKKNTLESIGLILEVIKKNVESAITANNNGKKVIAELRPFISSEKEKVVGKGKTRYYYKCEKCSVNCEENYKFKLNDVSAKICKMNSDNSAEFKYVNEKEDV